MSGLISDLLTSSLANHSRSLTENRYFNGHPDLIVSGMHPHDSVKAGADGVEMKSTRKTKEGVRKLREHWVYRKP